MIMLDIPCLADTFPWNAQMRPALPRALKAKAILQHSAIANSSSNNLQHGPRLPIAWHMDLLWLVVNVEIAFDSQQGMPKGKTFATSSKVPNGPSRSYTCIYVYIGIEYIISRILLVRKG